MPGRSLAPAVDQLLAGGLNTLLLERRDAGDSFQTIADHIAHQTGVKVTGETIRQWCAEADAAEQAKDAHPSGGAA